MNKSFKQACDEANVTRWIDDWDYEKNMVSPDDVASQSNKKYWFKCHRGLHESTAVTLCNITKNLYRAEEYKLCKKCMSIGQYIIDTYGEQYLIDTWSDLNTKPPLEISKGSKERIYLKCLDNNNHPDYDLMALNYTKSHNCPFCSGHRVCLDNSLGNVYPKSIGVWSDINDDTPYDYSFGSGQEAYWKCHTGKHGDYARSIDASSIADFKCPICAKENQRYLRGQDSPNWKGGITPKDKTDRVCQDYNEWRKEVYKRDNYTCQVCLDKSHNRLRAHHIYSFAAHPDLRFNVQNGIAICEAHHDTAYKGSFHQMYGTHNNTPEQFEEYVNNKRKELGINIPFNIYDFMSSIEDDDMEIDDYGLDL